MLTLYIPPHCIKASCCKTCVILNNVCIHASFTRCFALWRKRKKKQETSYFLLLYPLSLSWRWSKSKRTWQIFSSPDKETDYKLPLWSEPFELISGMPDAVRNRRKVKLSPVFRLSGWKNTKSCKVMEENLRVSRWRQFALLITWLNQ